jgi:outer membrane receptor protein involved in Fe transport
MPVTYGLSSGVVTLDVITPNVAVPNAAAEVPPRAPASGGSPPTEGRTTEPSVEPKTLSALRVKVFGVVQDDLTAEPIPGAQVFVFGEDIETTADAQGRFSIEVPAGSLSIAVVHPKFPTEALIDVHVGPKGIPPVTVRLPHAEQVDDLVLVGKPIEGGAASILNQRKKSSAVQDAIGSEDIAKSPDGSASAATRRIVGASIVGGQFLFVRGLGGRYSNVRLNGIPLPSTDPDLPGFQLDLFPTALLSSLTITKTFTPDIPGDFAGGSLNVETRSFPEEFLFKVTVGGSADNITTGQRFDTYRGGSHDYLGFDDGTRAMPDAIPPQLIQGQSRLRPGQGFPPEEVQGFARSLPNNWAMRESTAYPNANFGISVGDTVATEHAGKFGYFFTLGYRSRFKRDLERFNQFYLDGDANVQQRGELDRESSRFEANIGSLGTISYAPVDEHEFSVVGLLTQSATDQVRHVTGVSVGEGSEVDHRSFQFVERQLLFGQLLGKHRRMLDRLDVNWQLNTATIERDQPDTRNVFYSQTPAGLQWNQGLGSGERLYSSLAQSDWGGGLDTKLELFGESLAKSGYMTRKSERAFNTRRLVGDFIGTTADALLPPDELYSQSNVGETWELSEVSQVIDGFEAAQELHAGYAMAELQLFDPLRLSAGARYESFNQKINVVPPYEAWGELSASDQAILDQKRANRTDNDWLPSASLVYAITDTMNVRAAYGGTVARPQLRELAPFASQDFIRRRQIEGNPKLKRTFIHNFDLRWELFPSGTEVFAVSAFYKIFEHPIESVIVNNNGNLTFDNILGANNYGAEFEARWSLGLISPALADWSAVANLALVQSQIRLSDEQARVATSRKRPLAGQSPFIVNASIGYEPQGSPFSAFVYYNVFGRRIQDAGRQGLPDIYEEPVHALDLGLFLQPTEQWNFALSAGNLLLQPERYTQGGKTFTAFRPALTLSASAGFTY